MVPTIPVHRTLLLWWNFPVASSVQSNTGERTLWRCRSTVPISTRQTQLIIFMLIAPLMFTGLDASVPQKPTEQTKPQPRDDIVVTVLANETVLLNQDVVPLADLDARLRRLFKTAGNQVLFIRGERQLDFQQVAQVIYIAMGAGLDRIGLMTE
jgi:biopolymer transport protein TolR